MVRPVRNKKPVNYSQFEASDSDDDFISPTVPLSKKSRITPTPKELKQDKPKPNLKTVQKEDILLQENTPKKRMTLDDKIFQRGLEAALALSVKEHPPVTNDVQKSQGIEKHGSSKTETMNKSLHISNCSVAGDYLDLDQITEEDDACSVQGKRKAPEAAVQRRKMLLENSDGSSASDTEPDDATGEDSENDSDFDESEDEEDFTITKRKVKENKKKEVKVKSPVEKKEKKSKSKCNALVTTVDSSPATIKSEFQSSPKEVSSSEATRKPLQIRSPSAESRRPKWVPPASVSSSSNSSPLAGVTVKSPNQSLRLGLSRLARVKPLHPKTTGSQVW
uniref:RAD51 associated protein 1 n=1 Tax=Chinchilla lanigera TaxID=34839 RepID=A0A8C2VVJ6_CHILA